MGNDRKSREYFRVPCELQVRFRKVNDEELKLFKQYGLRPSPYTSLRMTIEQDLQRLSIREESKTLLEKAFQILLNIDQRLERLEEYLQGQNSDAPEIKESHEWVRADLSAGGIAFIPSKEKDLKIGDDLMLDLLFPSLPEQRVVCAGKVVHIQSDGNIGIDFSEIHQDDQEFIHRFVIEKEREVLRARAQEREK